MWTKGEESGNFLSLVSISNDCDDDSLLVKVTPAGPTCHTGTDTCWKEENDAFLWVFLRVGDRSSEERVENKDVQKSYVASLFAKGINKVAQKVGEEAVETVIEAMDNNDELFIYEACRFVISLSNVVASERL